MAPVPAGAGGASSSAAPPGWLRWEVTTAEVASSSSSSTQVYDAVVVCNGHFSRPRFPDLPGAASFPGVVMHSHNYRSPEAFRGQTVVLVGASSSGVDIAEEIAGAGAARWVARWEGARSAAAVALLAALHAAHHRPFPWRPPAACTCAPECGRTL